MTQITFGEMPTGKDHHCLLLTKEKSVSSCNSLRYSKILMWGEVDKGAGGTRKSVKMLLDVKGKDSLGREVGCTSFQAVACCSRDMMLISLRWLHREVRMSISVP